MHGGGLHWGWGDFWGYFGKITIENKRKLWEQLDFDEWLSGLDTPYQVEVLWRAPETVVHYAYEGGHADSETLEKMIRKGRRVIFALLHPDDQADILMGMNARDIARMHRKGLVAHRAIELAVGMGKRGLNLLEAPP